MKAHCRAHNSVSYRGMRAIQPARRMWTASIFPYTWYGHLSPSFPAKPVPTRRKVIIALVITIVSIIKSHSSNGIFQVRVVETFYQKIEERRKKYVLWKTTTTTRRLEASKALELWESVPADVIEKFTTKASDSWCDKKNGGLWGKELLEPFPQSSNLVQKVDLSWEKQINT